MIQFSKTVAYEGSSIVVKVTKNAGNLAVDGGTVSAHAVRLYLDGAFQYVVMATTETLRATITQNIEAMKRQIDELDDVGEILTELEFTEDGAVDQVATPTGLAAMQIGGSGGHIFIDWDSVPEVEAYEIQTAPDAGFATTTTTIGPPAMDPYDAGSFPAGPLYIRIRGIVTGMTTSAWASTSITVV